METEAEFNSCPKNYWEFYKKDIRPKLMEIDVFFKSVDGSADIDELASILSIPKQEILDTMKKNKLDVIDRSTLHVVMENGSSEICKLFRREIECGSPFTYTIENIAYIYNISIEKIKRACDELGIKEATAYTLPMIFSHVYLC